MSNKVVLFTILKARQAVASNDSGVRSEQEAIYHYGLYHPSRHCWRTNARILQSKGTFFQF